MFAKGGAFKNKIQGGGKRGEKEVAIHSWYSVDEKGENGFALPPGRKGVRAIYP